MPPVLVSGTHRRQKQGGKPPRLCSQHCWACPCLLSPGEPPAPCWVLEPQYVASGGSERVSFRSVHTRPVNLADRSVFLQDGALMTSTQQ